MRAARERPPSQVVLPRQAHARQAVLLLVGDAALRIVAHSLRSRSAHGLQCASTRRRAVSEPHMRSGRRADRGGPRFVLRLEWER